MLIAEDFEFQVSLKRETAGTAALFVAELSGLTKHYGFGSALDDNLKGRLVCGINHDQIQRHLLSEANDKPSGKGN